MYGAGAGMIETWAPGRVNLIGEHTDYSGGLVLPSAIELGISLEVHELADEISLSSVVLGGGRGCRRTRALYRCRVRARADRARACLPACGAARRRRAVRHSRPGG